MDRLIGYFCTRHRILISAKTARRLAATVRAMRRIDADVLLGVTGSDVAALLPRHVDVTLGRLRAILTGRRVSA